MKMQSTLRAVADAKREEIHSARPDDFVGDTVEQMTARNISALVVLEDDGGVVGIFSERDLLRRVVAENRDLRQTRLAEVMTRDPLCVEASTGVDDAMRFVTEQHIRHLPLVVGGELENRVSSDDLMAWAVQAQKGEIESLAQRGYVSGRKNTILLTLIGLFGVLAIIALAVA